jgi:sugar O-acyltransferase (sialic acid O-acetyltransferase NeuD family)
VLKPKIVIFGSCGHAKVIIDIIESDSSFELVGFIDKFKSVGDEILGYKIIGDEQSLPDLMVDYGFHQGVIGIGDNFVRSKVVRTITELAPNFRFVNCIHKSAKISKHLDMGIGNVVMPGATINASSIISNHCILNTNSSLDHDCMMEDFSSLAPNSVVGGDCNIGEYSNVGIGASIFHGINIGRNCIIGGGSLVNKNLESDSIYYGVPARFITNRKLGDRYL